MNRCGHNDQYRNGRCRPCHQASKRRHLYGITPEDHAALFAAQRGLCALCPDPATNVDHCHRTGRVRGLLCRQCNVALGKLGDTVAGLQRAVQYLRRAR